MAPGNRKPFSGKQKKQLMKQNRERKQHKKPLGESSSDEQVWINTQVSNDQFARSDASDNAIDKQDQTSSLAGSSLAGSSLAGSSAAVSPSTAEPSTGQSGGNQLMAGDQSASPLLHQLKVLKLHAQPNNAKSEANRFALKFFRESDAMIERLRKEATKPFVRLSPEQLQVTDEQLHQQLNQSIDFPKRPAWHSGLTREQLLANEQRYFCQYLEQLEKEHGCLQQFGYFELNLETWRQLWRTLEMSDVILLIADIRYCIYHFPPALLAYVRDTLKKPLILVLNKSDLVEPELVLAWVDYWQRLLPGVHVIPFAAYAGMKTKDKGRQKGKRYGKFCMASESVRRLYQVCNDIVAERIDLCDWQTKIESDLRKMREQHEPSNEGTNKWDASNAEPSDGSDDDWDEKSGRAGWTDKRKMAYECSLNRSRNRRNKRNANKKSKCDAKDKQGKQSRKSRQSRQSDSSEEDWSDEDQEDAGDNTVNPKSSNFIDQSEFDYKEFQALDQGVLTIGCIGHPNVGKSSVLNAIKGDVVVSVSRTPGHTKHFQTIFVTNNVRLCDCPGLVFPSKVPRALQVLMGCFPIAQLREPYSAVQYVAERMALEQVLRIQKPQDSDGESEQGLSTCALNQPRWSAMQMCEAWAEKRGYYTAKGARPDVYRAANQILRMALDGRTVCFAFYPPNYFDRLHEWRTHPELNSIRFLQQQKAPDESERPFKTRH